MSSLVVTIHGTERNGVSTTLNGLEGGGGSKVVQCTLPVVSAWTLSLLNPLFYFVPFRRIASTQ